VIGPARRHGRCARLPPLHRATTVGGHRFGEPLAKTGVGHHEIVIDLKQRYLIPHARFTLAEGIDPASDGCHPLAEVEIEALDQGGSDGPAAGRSDLFNGQLRTEATRCVTPTMRRRRYDLIT
jgi:hypothetical protein